MMSETYQAVTVRREEVRTSRVSVARQLIVAPFTVALMGDDDDPGLHSKHAPRTPYLLFAVAAPSKS